MKSVVVLSVALLCLTNQAVGQGCNRQALVTCGVQQLGAQVFEGGLLGFSKTDEICKSLNTVAHCVQQSGCSGTKQWHVILFNSAKFTLRLLCGSDRRNVPMSPNEPCYSSDSTEMKQCMRPMTKGNTCNEMMSSWMCIYNETMGQCARDMQSQREKRDMAMFKATYMTNVIDSTCDTEVALRLGASLDVDKGNSAADARVSLQLLPLLAAATFTKFLINFN